MKGGVEQYLANKLKRAAAVAAQKEQQNSDNKSTTNDTTTGDATSTPGKSQRGDEATPKNGESSEWGKRDLTRELSKILEEELLNKQKKQEQGSATSS